MKSCGPPNTSDGRFGESGVAIIAEAVSRPPSRDIAVQYPAGQRMHCVKLLGDGIMAREFDRQVAELQIRAAVLNRFSALGIPQTHPVG